MALQGEIMEAAKKIAAQGLANSSSASTEMPKRPPSWVVRPYEALKDGTLVQMKREVVIERIDKATGDRVAEPKATIETVEFIFDSIQAACQKVVALAREGTPAELERQGLSPPFGGVFAPRLLPANDLLVLIQTALAQDPPEGAQPGPQPKRRGRKKSS